MIDTDLKMFRHKYPVRVRNFEVDSQGIVHNAVYLEYCEIGRVEYVRELGIKLLPTGIFDNEVKINVKRNEINYELPARLDEIIDVYTRISYIKSSSFCFEHLLVNSETGAVFVLQKSVQVNLNPQTGIPERLPDHLRKIIIDFEGSNLKLINQN